MDIQGADEVYAIVVEIGSSTTKVGYAGEDAPSMIFPSYVGSVVEVDDDAMDTSSDFSGPSATIKKFYTGKKDLNFVRNGMELESPLSRGEISNWGHFERLLSHIIRDVLCVEPKDHPILLGEIASNRPMVREKTVRLLFEKFGFPAVYLSKTPVLTSYASGRPTALVVESGALLTTVTPVYEGYVLSRSTMRSGFAGETLSRKMLKLYNVDKKEKIRAPFMFEKKKTHNGIKVVDKKYNHVTRSFTDWSLLNIMDDIKKDEFFVSENPLKRNSARVPDTFYELPDGRKLQLGDERYRLCEEFFNPSAVLEMEKHKKSFEKLFLPSDKQSSNKDSDVSNENLFKSDNSIHQLAFDSIKRCEDDVKKLMYSTVLLSGGNTLLSNFVTRFEKEILAMTPHMIRTSNPLGFTRPDEDRQFTSWMGGSILSSLGSFNQCWMSKDQYKEFGESIVNKVCP